MSLRFSRASLYVELGEYQKAAESYEQISRLCPENIEALKTATMVVTFVLLAYSVNYLLYLVSLAQNGLIIFVFGIVTNVNCFYLLCSHIPVL